MMYLVLGVTIFALLMIIGTVIYKLTVKEVNISRSDSKSEAQLSEYIKMINDANRTQRHTKDLLESDIEVIKKKMKM